MKSLSKNQEFLNFLRVNIVKATLSETIKFICKKIHNRFCRIIYRTTQWYPPEIKKEVAMLPKIQRIKWQLKSKYKSNEKNAISISKLRLATLEINIGIC